MTCNLKPRAVSLGSETASSVRVVSCVAEVKEMTFGCRQSLLITLNLQPFKKTSVDVNNAVKKCCTVITQSRIYLPFYGTSYLILGLALPFKMAFYRVLSHSRID